MTSSSDSTGRDLPRREFMTMVGGATGASLAMAGLGVGPRAAEGAAGASTTGARPCVISSGNGMATTARAMELIRGGSPVPDALVAGVNIVEDDPNDMSVGLGGLPNEDGVVELDASVMDGVLHRAGSVAALQRIRNASSVALQVMRRTDHVMLVGEGALRFARALGFKEENLLTERAREAWLRWKANLGHDDDWLNDDERDAPDPRRSDAGGVPFTWGTIHCSGVDARGNVAAVTTTSGLSWKIPGRVGDSPIVGAGMYCDNAVGSGGATGRGEAVIQVCGAFSIVQHMEAGLAPTEACLAVAKRIADRTREKRLRDSAGRPNFNVTLYALRNDGAHGSASLWSGSNYAVHDGERHALAPSAFLFERTAS